MPIIDRDNWQNNRNSLRQLVPYSLDKFKGPVTRMLLLRYVN